MNLEDVQSAGIGVQPRSDEERLGDSTSDLLVTRARAWFVHRDPQLACMELSEDLRRPFAAILSEEHPGTDENAKRACLAVAEALAHELAVREASLSLLVDVARFLVDVGRQYFCDTLLRQIEKDRAASSWPAMLTAPPTDALAWLNRWRARDGIALVLKEEADRAFPRPPDGLLKTSYNHASFNEVGVLHLELAYRLAPRATAEMICGLPADQLAWDACHLLTQWGIDWLALIATLSPPACGLFLAAFVDDVDSELQRRAPRADIPHPMTRANAEARERFVEWVEGSYAAKYAAVATALSERQDGGRMLGPWLAFLARRNGPPLTIAAYVHPEQDRVPLRISIRVFAEHGRTPSFTGTQMAPAVLVARAMLLEAAPGNTALADSIWADWTALLLSDATELHTDYGSTAQVMGWVLAQCSEPHESWRRTARRIQPQARVYERLPWDQIDVVTNVVISAAIAAVQMGSDGESIWGEAFTMAIRHSLVAPTRGFDDPARTLPLWFFHDVARVFGENHVELLEMMKRLPTDELRSKAREMLPQPHFDAGDAKASTSS